ncbi:hypothetical protein THAOC_19129, partial [Thalassiosira oceanica]
CHNISTEIIEKKSERGGDTGSRDRDPGSGAKGPSFLHFAMTMFRFKHTLAVTLLVVASRSSSQFIALAFVSPRPPRPLKMASVEARTSCHRPLVVARTSRRRGDVTSRNLFGFGNAVLEDQKNLEEGELAKFQHVVPADDKARLPRGDSGASSSGVKLVFKKRKAAYSDADAAEDDGTGKEKDETIREGGVQVVVALLENDELQVTASRCDIDEGTIVKEMSEEAIVDSLRKAVAAWKKEQS